MFEKSKYLNKIYWSFDKSSNPYPLILIDNFLKTEIYKEIAENDEEEATTMKNSVVVHYENRFVCKYLYLKLLFQSLGNFTFFDTNCIYIEIKQMFLRTK